MTEASCSRDFQAAIAQQALCDHCDVMPRDRLYQQTAPSVAGTLRRASIAPTSDLIRILQDR